jgi:hypothetical protein
MRLPYLHRVHARGGVGRCDAAFRGALAIAFLGITGTACDGGDRSHFTSTSSRGRSLDAGVSGGAANVFPFDAATAPSGSGGASNGGRSAGSAGASDGGAPGSGGTSSDSGGPGTDGAVADAPDGAGGAGRDGGVAEDGGVPSSGGGGHSSGGGTSASGGAGPSPDAGAVPCGSDGDCSAPDRFCDLSSHVCVECLGSGNCGAGQTCVLATHRCEYACRTSADCSDPRPYCEKTTKTCVACLGNANCSSGSANLCDSSSHTCVECLTSADCACPLPLQLPCCTQSNTCTCSLLVCP